MVIVDIYSKRRRRELSIEPDVFTYDIFPNALRTQIVRIWHDVIGQPQQLRPYGDEPLENKCYQEILEILRNEEGVFKFSADTTDHSDPRFAHPELVSYFLKLNNAHKIIDVIELSFKYIDIIAREFHRDHPVDSNKIVDTAINDLNTRFLEHGVGYEYSNGFIIRIDSTFIHSQAVKPALLILKRSIYKNAEKEFLAAFEHYRHSRMSEALLEACKAFESTMKIICTKRKWASDPNKTAAQLIQICSENGLFPNYWNSHLTHLNGLLTSSIPTARNKQSGHGAGSSAPNNPPRELVSYVLHMTASTILFLSEAEQQLQ